MIQRGTKNSVLVEIEKISDNEYTFASGVKLFMDTSYSPEQHQRIYGTCVAVPEFLSKGDLVKFDDENLKYVDSIEPEVQVGDRVYFTYVTINKSNLLEYEGKSYYNINYSAILCVVRYGHEMAFKDGAFDEGKFIPEIIPIGGNVMCDEYYGKDADFTEVDGNKVFGEISKSGLITNIIKKPSTKHGIVRITGSPLKGDEIEVSAGDVVMFPDKFGMKNNIEGREYLFLKYWDIHAIVGNETESLI